MDVKSLAPEVRQIWSVAKVVQGVMGFTMGLYLFTWGPLFYEKLQIVSDPKLAITLTAVLIGITNFLIAFLEVPTGAIGDAVGRKKTVVWSLFCRMMFFIFLAWVPFVHSIPSIFTLGILVTVAFGFSYTFFSGTFTGWCVDSLREKAPDIGYEHLLSKAYTYNFVAQLFGGVLGVSAYLWHMPSVGFFLGAACCVGCVIYCLGEMEEVKNIQFLDRKKVSLSNITKRIGEILGVGFQVFRQSTVILALVMIFASYMFVVNIVDYLWPVYLRTRIPTELQSYYWIGLVIGILLISAAGSHSLTIWTKRWQKNNQAKTHNIILRRWLIGTCLLSALPILALSYLTKIGLDTFWFFAGAVLTVEYAYGVIAPAYETLVNNYIPDHHAAERATIMSFGSLLRSLLIMILAIPAGGSSGETTTIGWAIPAFLLLGCALFGNIILKRAQKGEVETGAKKTPETFDEKNVKAMDLA